MHLISVYSRWAVKNCRPPGIARRWAEDRGWLRVVQLHELGGTEAWLEDFTAWRCPELPFELRPGSGELSSTERAR